MTALERCDVEIEVCIASQQDHTNDAAERFGALMGELDWSMERLYLEERTALGGAIGNGGQMSNITTATEQLMRSRRMPEHGTNSRYCNGPCRCDLCKTAHNEAQRQAQNDRRARVAARTARLRAEQGGGFGTNDALDNERLARYFETQRDPNYYMRGAFRWNCTLHGETSRVVVGGMNAAD